MKHTISFGFLCTILMASSAIAGFFDGPSGMSLRTSTATPVLSTNDGVSMSAVIPVVASDPASGGKGGAMTMSLPVPASLPTNNIPASYLSLTDIEVLTNAVLDELVADYGTNALALYSFILNQVDFRGAAVNYKSTRGALGCYFEREGHDVDLCSLTIYLLRRCGIRCAYGFMSEPHMMPDQFYQIYGFECTVPGSQSLYYPGITNAIVYAFVNTGGVSSNWVALVPWWKQRTFIEGPELRDVLSNNGNGVGILDDYLQHRASVQGSISNTSDLVIDFLPDYLKNMLATNSPNTSVDQVGVRWRLENQQLSTWPTNYDISLASNAVVTAAPSLADSQRDKVCIKMVKSGGGVMFSNTFYTVELHNRRVLVAFQPATTSDWAKVTNGFYEAGTNFDMVGTLSLGATPQSASLVLTGAPTQTVRMGAPVTLSIDSVQRSVAAGDYGCYPFSFGRVTDEMLDQHFKVLADLSTQTKTATNMVWSAVDKQKLLGEQLCTVGMNYYRLTTRSSQQLEEWTKSRVVGHRWVGSVFFKLNTKGTSTYLADTMLLDMFGGTLEGCPYLHQRGSATNGPYRSAEPNAQERDFFSLWVLSGSTLEHGVLQKSVGFADAMSADKCLRVAIESGGYVTNLTATTYSNSVNRQTVSNVDASAYASIQTFFTTNPLGHVWFPSRQVTNGTYFGYGWLQTDVNTNNLKWTAAYLISGTNYGAYSQSYDPPAYQSTSLGQAGNNASVAATTPLQTLLTPVWGDDAVLISYAGQNANWTVDSIAGFSGSQGDQLTLASLIGQSVSGTVGERDAWGQSSAFYGGPTLSGSSVLSQDDVNALNQANNNGFLAPSLAEGLRSFLSTVADPVDTRTGEFYVDDLDLVIPGPKSIEFRRAYSSKCAAINEFGAGWRFNHSSYLAIGTNQAEIRAVEPDGSVISYTNTAANVWTVSPNANARLANQNEQGIGSTANPFVNRIDKTVAAGSTNYVLTTADGQARTYTVKSYVDGAVIRTRPYLAKWADANSNVLTYAYGADSNRFDFGRITEVRNANHAVKLKYNSAGNLWRALCDDGRLLQYEYSPAGGLTSVIRPDGSYVYYDYQLQAVPRAQTVDFNGTNASATCSSTFTNVQDTFTVEFWAKPSRTHEIDTRSTSGMSGTNGQRYALYPDQGGAINAGVGVSVGINGISVYENGDSYMPALLVYTSNVGQAWTHIAVVYSNKTPTLYVNGLCKTNGLTSPRAHVYPGRAWGGGSYGYFSGQLDECRIWRTNRTAAQILAGMDTSVATNDIALSGYWAFNDGTANDSSTNHNNATLSGVRIKNDSTKYQTHLIIRETKPGGRVLENTYDNQGRVVEQRATIGLSATPVRNATFSYAGDGINGSTVISNILGAATTYAYTNGMIVRETDALGFFSSNEWDSARNLITRMDKRGVVTRLVYDSKGNATNTWLIGDVTGSGGAVTSITWCTYTTNNLLATKTTPRGNVTRYYYDYNRNLTTQEWCYADSDPWVPTNNAVYRRDTFLYNAQGRLTNQTLAAGTPEAVTTAFVYDSDGNLTQSRLDPGQGQQVIVFNYTVDSRGWVTRKTDPTGAYSTFDHDAVGRVVSAAGYGADGVLLDRHDYTFDENGNPLVDDGPRSDLDDRVISTYDRQNRMVSRTTKRYQVTSTIGFAYVSDAVSTLVFDGFGNLIQTTDPNGNVSRSAFDAQGHLVAVTNYQGGSTGVLSSAQQWCDGGGLVVSNRTPRGAYVYTSYNALGQPVRKQYPDGAIEQWWYDVSGAVTQFLNPRSIKTAYTFDSFGRLTNRLDAVGTAAERSFGFVYDSRGNLLSTRDAQGGVSSNVYDCANRVVAEYGAYGSSPRSVFTNLYDGAGHLVLRVNPDVCVSNAFDGLGRIASTTWSQSPGSAPQYFENYLYTAYTLNDCQWVLRWAPSWYRGYEAVYNFLDEAGRTGLTLYDGFSASKQFRYDNSGNLVQQIDELGRTNAIAYDGLNRAVAVTTPDGVTVTNQFDSEGNQTNTLYPCGVSYIRQYDSRGRMTTERVAGSAPGSLFNNAYSYDLSGNVVTQTTSRGVSTVSTFDALDRRTALSAGAQTPLIPAVNLSFGYTPNGWLNVASDGTHNVSRRFDQNGRILGETNSINGTLQSFDQTFDVEGRRITCQVSPANESWSYQWNGADRLTNICWTGGDFNMVYDEQGRLTYLGGALAELYNTWGIRHTLIERTYWEPDWYYEPYYQEDLWYRADLACTNDVAYSMTLGYSSYVPAYDSLNQVTWESVGSQSGTALTNAFAYDAAALRTNLVSTGSAGSWARASSPDPFRRLATESTTVAGSNPVITVSGYVRNTANVLVSLNGSPLGYATVDTNAHLWTLSGVQLTGGSNVIAAVADPGKRWATNVVSMVTLNLYVRGSYAYDSDGNLVYANRGNKDYTYTFDALGRLALATMRDRTGNGWNWSAGYDPLGRRTETAYSTVSSNVAAPPTSTVTLWDPLYPAEEVYRQESGGAKFFYLYGPELSDTVGGLGGIGGLIAYRDTNAVHQVFNDRRGNVVGAASASSYSFHPCYSAFGMTGPPSPWINAPSFSTRRIDQTGLVYMGARYFDPVTGRFLSPDPSRFSDSRNLYALCGNDPVNGFDPDGRLGKGAYQGSEDMVLGAGTLAWNIGGAIGYGVTAGSDAYSDQWNGLKSTGAGLANLGDMFIHGEYYDLGVALSGGDHVSDAYRLGYAAPGIATILYGGELGKVNVGGRASEGAGAASSTLATGESVGQVTAEATAGKTIGLGLDEDLMNLRGTGAITYKNGGWQQAGLTTVDAGRATESSWFRMSFNEASQNAGAIRFDVSNFDLAYLKPGMTSWELNQVVNNPSLLGKTTFIQNGGKVLWNGTGFVKP